MSIKNEVNGYFIKGLFGWRSEKVERYKISGMMKKWEDRKDLVFPRVGLVGWVEKWENRKLFCKKSGGMKKCSLYKLTIIPLLHNMWRIDLFKLIK